MRRVIVGKTYDTETAQGVTAGNNELSPAHPHWSQESLALPASSESDQVADTPGAGHGNGLRLRELPHVADTPVRLAEGDAAGHNAGRQAPKVHI
jgi:hypothetical protein